jgi:NADH-quinone oxidoreductase subunit I
MAVIRPLLVGFATTLKHLFKKPVTVNYPEQKIPMFPKYRGKQVLMRDENNLEKCVACGLCSVACPADAIYLEAKENEQRSGRAPLRLSVDSQDAASCGY